MVGVAPGGERPGVEPGSDQVRDVRPIGGTAAAAAAGRSRPHVVVGVDPSASARKALHWAADYVRLAGGTLVAVTAAPGDEPGPDERPELMNARERKARAAREDAQQRLAEVLAEELGPAWVDVVSLARSGGVADVLVRASEGADLLVIGTTPKGRLGRALLGWVRPGALEDASCPVVLVRAPDPQR